MRIGDDVRARLGVDARRDVVVLTGIHARTGWKYMERGYRHVWWDAGTMLANLLALAAADGLEPRLYTAFVDADVNDALGIDGEHRVRARAARASETARRDVPARICARTRALLRSRDADAVGRVA